MLATLLLALFGLAVIALLAYRWQTLFSDSHEITGSNWPVNTLLTVEVYASSKAWGMPYERRLGIRHIQTDEKGRFCHNVNLLSKLYAPQGAYQCWVVIHGVPSKPVTRIMRGFPEQGALQTLLSLR